MTSGKAAVLEHWLSPRAPRPGQQRKKECQACYLLNSGRAPGTVPAGGVQYFTQNRCSIGVQ